MNKTTRWLFFLTALPVLFAVSLARGQQPVKDPLLSYYEENYAQIKNAGVPDNVSPVVTLIKCDLTGDGRSSYLITDDSKNGYRKSDDSDWTLYYPKKGMGYLHGGWTNEPPLYIGYVKQINACGVVYDTDFHNRPSEEHLCVYSYSSKDDSWMSSTIGSGEGVEGKYPEYFTGTENFKTVKYTLADLNKMYPKAKLNTGIVDDPLHDYFFTADIPKKALSKKEFRIYTLSAKFGSSTKVSIFVADDSEASGEDYYWHYYEALDDGRYLKSSEIATSVDEDHDRTDYLSAPVTGPTYIGPINETIGGSQVLIECGAVSMANRNSQVYLQFPSNNLIKSDSLTTQQWDEQDREKFIKFLTAPKTFIIKFYSIEELIRKYGKPPK